MEKISVVVRFRPHASSSESNSTRQWQIQDNAISLFHLATPVPGSTFSFDHVLDDGTTNTMVYDLNVKSIIQAAINGFNGTAFAYGQTSSGKTYTMNGSEKDPGIIPLAIKDIFDTVHTTMEREFLIRVSYMEIYNEEINDLLKLENQKLPIHENLDRGVYVSGLREEIVNDSEQVLELLRLGEANRHFGETNMNSRSSRSHTIFRMVIESSAKEAISSEDAIRVSVLNLVDLAGSERISKTGAEGMRLKEGKYINKSLTALGNVINKLSESSKSHIPYRDSKLTRILEPALGGNAKTSIICTVAPEEMHIEETRGTLQFASRAKRITNCVKVNEILTDGALLKRQKLEIEELRRKLQGSHSEVLEQMILKQRNDMHKSELERERLATELEEERRIREELERRLSEREKKVENLTNSSLSKYQFSDSAKATPDKSDVLQFDALKTPNFKQPPIKGFIAKRSNYIKEEIYSSPMPVNFADMANEDMWTRLNKGCFTDLDALQMTPVMMPRQQEVSSFEERERLETLKERYNKLEQENNMLSKEKESLIDALTKSEIEIDQLKSEKLGVVKELKEERVKLSDLRDDIRCLMATFSKREGMLNSLYYKSKAMAENMKANQIVGTEM
ncbi:hypothetical protein LUZ60_004699 [Juncus effusus]|nr:hypothetical protein LUZ60_004699 [Juncus effusus]